MNRPWLVLRLVGGGLLLATGAIHLDLYITGYRTIPTIGWLFLLQMIAAFGLGVVVVFSASRLVSAAGAGLAVATLGGFLLSLRVSLFGFREVRTSAGIVAGVIEVTVFVTLAACVLRPVEEDRAAAFAPGAHRTFEVARATMPAARWTAGAVSIAAGVLLGLSLATASPSSTGGSTGSALLNVTTIHGVSVLTNARGYTLYWFAPDSATKSTCYGTCAAYWPPAIGSPVAGERVTGRLGTIKRAGGTTQVTYDGHPLYTYVGDSAPGQATGNDIDLNGGYWYEMTETGTR